MLDFFNVFFLKILKVSLDFFSSFYAYILSQIGMVLNTVLCGHVFKRV